ncbi:universal stress protein [Haloferax mediterranei ATCC 33500]|uniref:Universal stress protein n=1 Tax=Haloferax mediterranei (strain ATCC 33500 / DSM 1411 / JCM 8866 / NBRC 14739 / NCIMB 2177 / R-4) TaxID=523841 RepID=I3R355_HALMT|nr:universal stress protein [Haloferax mediterranei]AFK18665.1 putative universal stress protein [Haloferax mediterranei ATCC 33500]AHZ21965.1 universal stress protein UspA [Haloferax mediterranei ATCC 33500]EMA03476.1 putative universal stress protein [Haloferax mediterranei ATCC 33500]MDX5988760.1 universal stress protein [Haloferax mediterranei ATCC 33500]QCQ75165.1 universal stress protein [Haloferax mediterranei ATCC 33500]
MYETILVPTDGSSRSRAAANHAIDIASTYGATVHVLSVIDSSDLGLWTSADVPIEQVKEDLRDDAETAIEDVVALADGLDVPSEADIRIGVPSREILDTADEVGADLIVMATHGRTGLRHAILGSTTERVVRVSDVPVLTVRA